MKKKEHYKEYRATVNGHPFKIIESSKQKKGEMLIFGLDNLSFTKKDKMAIGEFALELAKGKKAIKAKDIKI